MEKTTLYVNSVNTIGQISIDQADKEIKRMEAQTGKEWMKNFSDQMVVLDDPNRFDTLLDYLSNGNTDTAYLQEGKCWIVSDVVATV